MPLYFIDKIRLFNKRNSRHVITGLTRFFWFYPALQAGNQLLSQEVGTCHVCKHIHIKRLKNSPFWIWVSVLVCLFLLFLAFPSKMASVCVEIYGKLWSLTLMWEMGTLCWGVFVFWITGYWCGFSWEGEVCYVRGMARGMPRMLVAWMAGPRPQQQVTLHR